MQGPAQVDTDRFSRQIYTIGLKAMQRLQEASVLLLGTHGAFAEVSKNIVLSGVKSVYMVDPLCSTASWSDLSTNFFLTEDDVLHGRRIVDCSCRELVKLNPTVIVQGGVEIFLDQADGEDLTRRKECPTFYFASFLEGPHSCNENTILRFAIPQGGGSLLSLSVPQVVVCLNPEEYFASRDHLFCFNEALIRSSKGMSQLLVCSCYGVFSSIHADFGDKFVVDDPIGQEGGGIEGTHFLVNSVVEASSSTGYEHPVNITFLNLQELPTTDYSLQFSSADPRVPNWWFHIAACTMVKEQIKSVVASVQFVITLSLTQQVNNESNPQFVNESNPDDSVACRMEFKKFLFSKSCDSAPLYAKFRHNPVTIKCHRLRGNATKPSIIMSYSSDGEAAHSLWWDGLWSLREQLGRLPQKNLNQVDTDALGVLERSVASYSNGRELAQKFYRGFGGNLGPFCAFVGGMLAQEVLKAVTHKYTPIRQSWYFDACQLLSLPSTADAPATKFIGTRYEGLLPLLVTDHRLERLHNATVFLVGAGAIGCEYLKNLALLGFGTGKAGSVVIADHDRIEKSNLCRQFLFRDTDIGRLKAQTAADKVRSNFNAKSKIRVLTEKVASSTAGRGHDCILNDRFWSKLSCVCTAVDNMEARKLLSSLAKSHSLPLIDSGTLGAMGHVEVVVPHVTNPYAAADADTSDHKIPFCTLHFFPTSIHHCVQYAVDFFAQLFTMGMQNVLRFLSSTTMEGYLNTLERAAQPVLCRNLFDTLFRLRPRTFRDCIQWCRLQFEATFVHPILDLMASHPADSVEVESGKQYWSGARIAPHAPCFSPHSNVNHRRFLLEGSKLLAMAYGVAPDLESDDVVQYASEVEIPPYTPRIVKTDVEDSANGGETIPPAEDTSPHPLDDIDAQQHEEQELRDSLRELLEGDVETHNDLSSRLVPIHFEKDDDCNGHVEFVTAVSNTRAACYGIPCAEILEVKKISGRIVPAMITTTAAVTGLARYK